MTLRPDPDHDAVCASSGRHIAVVAPPGSGKTALSVRFAATVAPSLEPSGRVLLLTFSNQARVQLEREAVRQLDAALRPKVEVTNYHSFFRKEVWAYRRALGLPMGVSIGSARRRYEALKRVDPETFERLRKRQGMLEAFAEQGFERFRDERTPDSEALAKLLNAVHAEQRGGRLVFDDLGALFWRLLETYPVLDRAYKARFPVVIADEHQDASELQDAVVRRLARKRLLVFADPMQLIYGFRGSRPERLQRHIAEADARFELKTPHRWHGAPQTGRWLLAVRARLLNQADSTPPPAALQIVSVAYVNQMKGIVKQQAAKALRDGLDTVAVIAAINNEVRDLRQYLCGAGLYPRQLGGGDDFEDAQAEIEQLPLLQDVQSVAHHATDRIGALVPTLKDATIKTVKRRLLAASIDLSGNCGADAKALLSAFASLYTHGPDQYFPCVVAALDACAAQGHHLPRVEAVQALRATADALSRAATDSDAALASYSQNVAAAAQAAPQLGRGLYVMTAHQAKGKEFDAVIVFNAGARQFPDSEDGRRLFYVAVTRASKRWIVIAPNQDPSPLLSCLWT